MFSWTDLAARPLGGVEPGKRAIASTMLHVQATVSEVVPSRSCGSVEWHGACPSAGTFRVRLEGPATLWGEPATPCIGLRDLYRG